MLWGKPAAVQEVVATVQGRSRGEGETTSRGTEDQAQSWQTRAPANRQPPRGPLSRGVTHGRVWTLQPAAGTVARDQQPGFLTHGTVSPQMVVAVSH